MLKVARHPETQLEVTRRAAKGTTHLLAKTNQLLRRRGLLIRNVAHQASPSRPHKTWASQTKRLSPQSRCSLHHRQLHVRTAQSSSALAVAAAGMHSGRVARGLDS